MHICTCTYAYSHTYIHKHTPSTPPPQTNHIPLKPHRSPHSVTHQQTATHPHLLYVQLVQNIRIWPQQKPDVRILQHARQIPFFIFLAVIQEGLIRIETTYTWIDICIYIYIDYNLITVAKYAESKIRIRTYVMIYMYTCIYIHIYTCIHMYTHMCIYIHIYTYIYTVYIYVFIYIYMCIHVYMYIYTYI